MIQVGEGTPVIGHVTAGVYAATGDLEKAEDVALGATKSTVIAAAGIAGAACGPGAVACGASLAVSANALWDTSDSLISGKYILQFPLLKSEAKKRDTLKNWPSMKNPQFLSYPHETW